MPIRFPAWLLCHILSIATLAAQLALPPRDPGASGGTALAAELAGLNRVERERVILEQIAAGNVPDSWRRFVPVTIQREIEGEPFIAEILVAPDYLGVGSDADPLLTPLSPRAAQEAADSLECLLPTRRMADLIYHSAAIKLVPSPIPPSPAMIKVETWLQHQIIVRDQLAATSEPFGLRAGHKKDVVVTSQLTASPGKVAIYGWHRVDETPIQPLYLGHTEAWVDYSHGIRLIARGMKLNARETTVDAVLADPKLSILLSDEGVIANPRYPDPPEDSAQVPLEKMETLTFDSGVRVVLNSPVSDDPTKPVRLILYALPNGNSIEQTSGHRLAPGEDWHFNIQHIAAQTRWLREKLSDATAVVAYFECEGKSWPAWRRKSDPTDERIARMVDELRERYAGRKIRLTLTGHSGGGSFIFGLLNGLSRIPDDVERIAFLDSNYAYDSAKGHGEKLGEWLSRSTDHYLTVVAYEDYVALLNGKTFVSEKGGTWGRSQAMLADLAAQFRFDHVTESEWENHSALEGRVKFFLRRNPAKAILHTRLVEYNGFIHAMLSGTPLESRGYQFFGARAYQRNISAE